MIELDRVSLWLGRARVLHEVSLAIPCGEVVAVVGPNGAGKSSLVRVAAGELQASRGAVRLDDRAIGTWTDLRLAQRRAFLTQRTTVTLPFSVEEVVAMGRAPHADEDRAVIHRCLRAAGIAHLAGRTLTTLSGGEAQRVHVARVLAQLGSDPAGKALLLDEPTSALDLEHQHSVLAIARSIAREGAAVAVVLHDLALAALYADRIVAMCSGRIEADGPPARVLTRELLRRVFRVDAEIVFRDGGGALIATSSLGHGAT